MSAAFESHIMQLIQGIDPTDPDCEDDEVPFKMLVCERGTEVEHTVNVSIVVFYETFIFRILQTKEFYNEVTEQGEGDGYNMISDLYSFPMTRIGTSDQVMMDFVRFVATPCT